MLAVIPTRFYTFASLNWCHFISFLIILTPANQMEGRQMFDGVQMTRFQPYPDHEECFIITAKDEEHNRQKLQIGINLKQRAVEVVPYHCEAGPSEP